MPAVMSGRAPAGSRSTPPPRYPATRSASRRGVPLPTGAPPRPTATVLCGRVFFFPGLLFPPFGRVLLLFPRVWLSPPSGVTSRREHSPAVIQPLRRRCEEGGGGCEEGRRLGRHPVPTAGGGGWRGARAGGRRRVPPGGRGRQHCTGGGGGAPDGFSSPRGARRCGARRCRRSAGWNRPRVGVPHSCIVAASWPCQWLASPAVRPGLRTDRSPGRPVKC
jgi:hypothetical protein